MSRKKNMIVYLMFLFLILLFVPGCWRKRNSQQEHAFLPIRQYVEAAKLKENNENQKAIELLTNAVEKDKSFSLGYSLLGDIYQDMQYYSRSASSYENAIQINPWSFHDHFNLGKVYYAIGRFTQAREAYLKAIAVTPDSFEANTGVARSCYKIQDYKNALIYANKANEIEPARSNVQKLLGDIFKVQKNYDKAVASYKRSLEINENNPETIVALAVTYLEQARNLEAKELLLRAVEIKPDFNLAYQYLGYCYLQLRNIEKSIESYKRAILIDGNDWRAHKGLGSAYMLKGIMEKQQKMIDMAIEQWRESLSINPEQPQHEQLKRAILKYTLMELRRF